MENNSCNVLKQNTVLSGKYVINKVLGAGGFGITYLAFDQYMKTRIAIKEFYPGSLVMRDTTRPEGNTVRTVSEGAAADFKSGLERYTREAAILATLFQLEGIVSVKDFFYENGTAYIVMEYLEGISLKEFLDRRGGKITTEETLRIMEPVIRSLAVIHDNHLLHRDISPDNIMICNDGRVKLIDFGAARYLGNQGELSMTVVLKHGYAPIEQYARKGGQGSWTDEYGLCATMYRMITGVVPVESVERVADDTLKPVRKLDKTVPKHVAAAIEKGLAVYAKNRYSNVKELYRQLYLSGEAGGKQAGSIYCVIRGILLAMVLLLAAAAGAIILYGKSKDSALSEDRVEPASSMAQLYEPYKQESQSDTGKKDGEVQEQKMEDASRKEENFPDEEAAVHEEEEIDEQLQYSMTVVKDGRLKNTAQNMTVGELLDVYSDTSGNFYAYREEDGRIIVFYEGIKDGISFGVAFEVYQDDTFKLVGATENNEMIEEYAAFFQGILDKIG